MKKIADIVREEDRVISRTGTALPAVRRGIRLTCAKHTFVRKSVFFIFRTSCFETYMCTVYVMSSFSTLTINDTACIV